MKKKLHLVFFVSIWLISFLFACAPDLAAPPTYKIIIAGTPNGILAANVTSAILPGKVINMTVTADQGYGCLPGSLYFESSDGVRTIIHDKSFTMPAENLTIGASFGTFTVGDTGPSGGRIVYVKASFSDGWKYLEIAPWDQSDGAAFWNTESFILESTGYTLGTGFAASEAILAALGTSGNYAAQICHNFVLDGYEDWFLPTTYELVEAFKTCGSNGSLGFTGGYWVSRFDASDFPQGAEYVSWNYNASTPIPSGSGNFSELKKVRAIRQF